MSQHVLQFQMLLTLWCNPGCSWVCVTVVSSCVWWYWRNMIINVLSPHGGQNSVSSRLQLARRCNIRSAVYILITTADTQLLYNSTATWLIYENSYLKGDTCTYQAMQIQNIIFDIFFLCRINRTKSRNLAFKSSLYWSMYMFMKHFLYLTQFGHTQGKMRKPAMFLPLFISIRKLKAYLRHLAACNSVHVVNGRYSDSTKVIIIT